MHVRCRVLVRLRRFVLAVMATPLRDERFPFETRTSCSKLLASGTAALLARRCPAFVFGDPCREEAKLRAFLMKTYSPSALVDVTKSFWCCPYPVPTKTCGPPHGNLINISYEKSSSL